MAQRRISSRDSRLPRLAHESSGASVCRPAEADAPSVARMGSASQVTVRSGLPARRRLTNGGSRGCMGVVNIDGSSDRVELPVACTLGLDDGAERMRRWQQLAGRASPVTRRIGRELELRFGQGPGVLDELQALAAAEAMCCPFVTWTVTVEHRQPILRVIASESSPDDIDAIARAFGGRDRARLRRRVTASGARS